MNRLIFIALVVVTIAFLSPLRHVGFIDDDAYNSYINGWIGWHGLSWWTFYTSVVQLWIHGEGRFMPLNLASVYALFHLTQSETVAKVVQVALIGLNVATLAALARRLAGSWSFGLLAAAACVPLTLQIRFSLDPIGGFEPLLPVTLEFVLLALLLRLGGIAPPKPGTSPAQWPHSPQRPSHMRSPISTCSCTCISPGAAVARGNERDGNAPHSSRRSSC